MRWPPKQANVDGDSEDDVDAVEAPSKGTKETAVKTAEVKKSTATEQASARPAPNGVKKAGCKRPVRADNASNDALGEVSAAAHLIEDDGEQEAPVLQRAEAKGGRGPNAAQLAREREEAVLNDPNRVTRGDDVPNMDSGDKTRAGQEVLQDIYPPFAPEDGQWEKGWETNGTHLGTGGQGCVSLYRTFEDDAVADRVVVKDSMLSGGEWSCWYKWQGDVRICRTGLR